MNSAAAAAAEARAKANAMSVSELRAELVRMGINSDGAVEKNDLVVLYMRGRKAPAWWRVEAGCKAEEIQAGV